jgi:hypothetical protein
VNGISEVMSSDTPLDVQLEGGPADIPASLRTQRITNIEHRVKIPHRGGYEHFERTVATEVPPAAGESSDSANIAPVVFHWTMRTKIAE